MTSIIQWIEQHPTLFAVAIWPAFTWLITWAFKPRTAAEYERLHPKLAALLKMIGALGLDAPAVIKAAREWKEGYVPRAERPTNPEIVPSVPPAPEEESHARDR